MTQTELENFAKITSMLRSDIEIRANSFRVEDKGEQDDSDCEHKDHQKIMRRSFTNKKDRQK